MRRRFSGFDYIRGVGVLLITLIHSESLNINFQLGSIALDAFFVLSGYLIAGILFTEYRAKREINPVRFFVRRGLKIYPLFYLVFAGHLLYYYIKGISIDSNRILAEIFFFQNYQEGIIGISWSLALEEHFYFFLLLLILALNRNKLVHNQLVFVGITVSILAFCLVMRIITFSINGWAGPFVNDFPTHLRIDAFFYGVCISYFYQFKRSHFFFLAGKIKWLLPIIIFCLILPVLYADKYSMFLSTFGYTFKDLACSLIIIVMILQKNDFYPKFKVGSLISYFNKLLVFLGRCSYAIYLVHFLVGPAVANYAKDVVSISSNLIYGLVYLSASCTIGILLTYLIERPLLKYRDRKYPPLVKEQLV